MVKIAITIFFLTAINFYAFAQKQLVFIQRGKVVARYTEGDNYKFKLKNGKKANGFIVSLEDFSILTSNDDTIKFQSIAKIRGLRRIGALTKIGRLLFLGGFGYVAIDQLNSALGYGKKGFDDADRNGLIVGGVGAAMLFIKPRYQRIKPGTLIRSIDYKSPYYVQPEPQ
ncbi:MAG: hypothetical protein WDN75_12865 [Bacteroidota bacterium]